MKNASWQHLCCGMENAILSPLDASFGPRFALALFD